MRRGRVRSPPCVRRHTEFLNAKETNRSLHVESSGIPCCDALLKELAIKHSPCQCQVVSKGKTAPYKTLTTANFKHRTREGALVETNSIVEYGSFVCHGYVNSGGANTTKYTVYGENSDGSGKYIIAVWNDEPRVDHAAKTPRIRGKENQPVPLAVADGTESELASSLVESIRRLTTLSDVAVVDDGGMVITGTLTVGDDVSILTLGAVFQRVQEVVDAIQKIVRVDYRRTRDMTKSTPYIEYDCRFARRNDVSRPLFYYFAYKS